MGKRRSLDVHVHLHNDAGPWPQKLENIERALASPVNQYQSRAKSIALNPNKMRSEKISELMALKSSVSDPSNISYITNAIAALHA